MKLKDNSIISADVTTVLLLKFMDCSLRKEIHRVLSLTSSNLRFP